jgi:hypothetical protein
MAPFQLVQERDVVSCYAAILAYVPVSIRPGLLDWIHQKSHWNFLISSNEELSGYLLMVQQKWGMPLGSPM